MDSSKAASTVLMTNPRWLAPCVLSGLPGQLAADVWAFGTVSRQPPGSQALHLQAGRCAWGKRVHFVEIGVCYGWVREWV